MLAWYVQMVSSTASIRNTKIDRWFLGMSQGLRSRLRLDPTLHPNLRVGSPTAAALSSSLPRRRRHVRWLPATLSLQCLFSLFAILSSLYEFSTALPCRKYPIHRLIPCRCCRLWSDGYKANLFGTRGLCGSRSSKVKKTLKCCSCRDVCSEGPSTSSSNGMYLRQGSGVADCSSSLPSSQVPGRPPKVVVLGGDGFCGWPTSLRLSRQGYEVIIVDNLSRRNIDEYLGTSSLTPIAPINKRVETWNKVRRKLLASKRDSNESAALAGRKLRWWNTHESRRKPLQVQQQHSGQLDALQDPTTSRAGRGEVRFVYLDLAKDYYRFVDLLATEKPDAIVHFAEQRAAPYSMKNARCSRYTVDNNTTATHNVLAAIVEATRLINQNKPVLPGHNAGSREFHSFTSHEKGYRSDHCIHLVHLGTMGVYGYGGGISPDSADDGQEMVAPHNQCSLAQAPQEYPSFKLETNMPGGESVKQSADSPQCSGLPSVSQKKDSQMSCATAPPPPSTLRSVSDVIPEGYLNVTLADGQRSNILHPANPGSVYHMTKCIDALMFQYYVKNYGLSITDLHQGIVWGTNTEETNMKDELINRFDYDSDYGTVLNRFLVQSSLGLPLTVYGTGGQTRAFIHISDTCKCIEMALGHRLNEQANELKRKGRWRPSPRVLIFNQVAETLRLRDIAGLLNRLTGAPVSYLPNPREEADENSLYVANTKFRKLGWKPILLRQNLLEEVRKVAEKYRHRCDSSVMLPSSFWNDNRASNYVKDSTKA
eukprot:GHVS01103147.1.p1 GENE.GHVS01103147.1~~GHVS01103147.1.p1  ORF type:complete len:765 (+),score=31.71 GHVS01103147.1:96-2390(+)